MKFAKARGGGRVKRGLDRSGRRHFRRTKIRRFARKAFKCHEKSERACTRSFCSLYFGVFERFLRRNGLPDRERSTSEYYEIGGIEGGGEGAIESGRRII